MKTHWCNWDSGWDPLICPIVVSLLPQLEEASLAPWNRASNELHTHRIWVMTPLALHNCSIELVQLWMLYNTNCLSIETCLLFSLLWSCSAYDVESWLFIVLIAYRSPLINYAPSLSTLVVHWQIMHLLIQHKCFSHFCRQNC